jgi:hypothetical protein
MKQTLGVVCQVDNPSEITGRWKGAGFGTVPGGSDREANHPGARTRRIWTAGRPTIG